MSLGWSSKEKLSGIHQFLAYADVTLLGDKIDELQKNTETLLILLLAERLA
jgi:hypothetical protein